MTILGINAIADRSSVCSIDSNGMISAICEKHNRAFPHSSVDALQRTYENIHTVVTVPHAANEVRKAMPRARIEQVDYCEALSMATISSTDWSSCAILLIDSYYTRLGYYVDGAFYWIRDFVYPNSIALFSAAVTRFLGFDPLVSEDEAWNLSLRGDPIYKSWILRLAVAVGDGSYQILHNLERGFGTAVPSADIAASAQGVFTEVVLRLAAWLRKHVDIPRLAIVGRGASNYITNQEISMFAGYDKVAAISINGAAATALGAAALLRRPIYEHHYVGPDRNTVINPDSIAAKLLQGEIVTYAGMQEFSDNNFISNCRLTLPFEPRLHALSNATTYAICQDLDYNKYFKGTHLPFFGQYLSTVTNRKALNHEHARVITVSKNKNPYINRVLELTRAQGYPILVSTPIT